MIRDLLRIAVSNLWKSKLRTFLTVLGVVIGIASLTSMISFGVGMEKNITGIYEKSDVFTSIMVSSKAMGLEQLQMEETDSNDFAAPPLNDSMVDVFMDIKGVDISFAEQVFPITIELDSSDAVITARALPAAMSQLENFGNLAYGSFYDSDSADKIVLSVNALRRLDIKLKTEKQTELTKNDSLKGVVLKDANEILGQKVVLKSKVVDVKKMMSNPMRLMMNPGYMPMKETSIELIISGIIKDDKIGTNIFRAGIFIPSKTVEDLPRLNFTGMTDILKNDDSSDTYEQVYVKAKSVNDIDEIVDKIKDMGYETFTISEQLTEIKRAFKIVDALLGAIGIIALIVSALGIMNTMVMSILERTRDIGVMKAIGGSERDIKRIFFFEASLIGLCGGIFGIILGWLVTSIAQMVMKMSVFSGVEDVPEDLFFFPWWLIVSAILFSIFISLMAGMYPAARAARIDPVRALRHD